MHGGYGTLVKVPTQYSLRSVLLRRNRYRYRYRYGRCRGTIFNERRPARHGQWRTPWIVSPEARWPTHVFGKSFLGDGGVKPSRPSMSAQQTLLHPEEYNEVGALATVMGASPSRCGPLM